MNSQNHLSHTNHLSFANNTPTQVIRKCKVDAKFCDILQAGASKEHERKISTMIFPTKPDVTKQNPNIISSEGLIWLIFSDYLNNTIDLSPQNKN